MSEEVNQLKLKDQFKEEKLKLRLIEWVTHKVEKRLKEAEKKRGEQ